jgi:hypothetical protein
LTSKYKSLGGLASLKNLDVSSNPYLHGHSLLKSLLVIGRDDGVENNDSSDEEDDELP